MRAWDALALLASRVRQDPANIVFCSLSILLKGPGHSFTRHPLACGLCQKWVAAVPRVRLSWRCS